MVDRRSDVLSVNIATEVFCEPVQVLWETRTHPGRGEGGSLVGSKYTSFVKT